MNILHTTQTKMSVQAFFNGLEGATIEEISKTSKDTCAWYVSIAGESYFCKWVESDRYEALLAKDVAICASDLHASIPGLLNNIRTSDGRLLVFERVKGETLTKPEARARFFALPVGEKISALHSIISALTVVVEAGWIIVDFYDGNVIYDFDTQAAYVFDFELFERGIGFALALDCNYGSSRLMAPEEFVRGAWIDQRSNVYTLGRYAICTLSTQIDAQWRSCFQGSSLLADVLEHATQLKPADRYPTVRAFHEAFTAAIADN